MRTARKPQVGAADHIGQLLLGTVMTQTFFTTTSEYYGIGPLDMRPDDVVFVLYSSNALLCFGLYRQMSMTSSALSLLKVNKICIIDW